MAREDRKERNGRTGHDDKRVAGGGRPCPICGEPSLRRWRPFCSRRCADIDLHRWLSGAYVIAGGTSVAPQEGREEEESSPRGS